MNTVQTAVNAINSMNSDELEQIVDAIKLRRTYLSRARGRVVRGTVFKVNPKTVIVKEQGYGNWKVPAAMLTRVDTETA